MKKSSTPYDDVHRTMVNDCPQLLIPLVNEVFKEHYTGEEKVVLGSDVHYLEQQDGEEDKRITDSHFMICGSHGKRNYHIESQSTEDHSMIIRMFEYDAQIALEDAELTAEGLMVEFPKAAVIYLNSSRKTPDKLSITIKTPDGKVTYAVPVMKIKNYSVDELFEKKLYFLIPFHIFVYKNQFKVYNRNEQKLEELELIYQDIMERLEALSEKGELDEYTRHCIIDMSKKVLGHIAVGHEKVKEGVGNVMGGRILDYEAKRIYNSGRSEGRSEGLRLGRSEGATSMCISLVKDGIINLSEAAKRLDMNEDESLKYM